jgi:hypothetical protein
VYQSQKVHPFQIYFVSISFKYIDINLLFAIQLLIYIIYGDRTIIGFVGFVANLLNRPTAGATVSVRKNGSEKDISVFSINQERKVLSGFATVNVRSLNLINYVDVLYKTSAVFRYPQATSGLVTQSSNTFVRFSHKPVFTFSNPRNFGG